MASRGQVDAPFIFFIKADIRRLLVQSNAKTLELSLQDFLVGQRLEHIKANVNQIACPRDCNHLNAK